MVLARAHKVIDNDTDIDAYNSRRAWIMRTSIWVGAGELGPQDRRIIQRYKFSRLNGRC